MRATMTEIKIERITIPIFGLGCGGGGVLTLERALGRMPGVTRVYVNPSTEMAYVHYDPASTGPDEIVAAIGRAGFQAGAPTLR